jgi:hypothetical protein
MRLGVFISFYCGSFITKYAYGTRYTAIGPPVGEATDR